MKKGISYVTLFLIIFFSLMGCQTNLVKDKETTKTYSSNKESIEKNNNSPLQEKSKKIELTHKHEIEILTKALNQAEKMDGIVDFYKGPTYFITFRNKNGALEQYNVWLDDTGHGYIEKPESSMTYRLTDSSISELTQLFKSR